MNLQEVLSQVISECWSNPNFKAEFIANPEEAIKTLTGKTVVLPEGMDSIQVVDESNPTTIYVNIPAEPNLDNVELSEQELEMVSGGSVEAFNAIKIIRCGTNILPRTGGPVISLPEKPQGYPGGTPIFIPTTHER